MAGVQSVSYNGQTYDVSNMSAEDIAAFYDKGQSAADVEYTMDDGTKVTGKELASGFASFISDGAVTEGTQLNLDSEYMQNAIKEGKVVVLDDSGNPIPADQAVGMNLSNKTIQINDPNYGAVTVKLGGNGQLDMADDVMLAAGGDAAAAVTGEAAGAVTGEINTENKNAPPEGTDGPPAKGSPGEANYYLNIYRSGKPIEFRLESEKSYIMEMLRGQGIDPTTVTFVQIDDET